MKFFFDESGDFNPRNNANKLSLVACVAIPDCTELAFRHGFANFVKTLDKNELAQGELKGYLLSTNSRKRFCMLLNSFRSVLVVPQTLLYSILEDHDVRNLRRSFSGFLLDYSKYFKYKTMRDDMSLLARQVKNLHESQLLRLLTLSRCVFSALHHSILFRTNGPYRSNFDRVDLVFDPMNKRTGNRESDSFLKLIKGWTLAWSKKEPFVLVKEIHTKDHPFVKKYHRRNGMIDLTEIIRNGIHYPDSKMTWGLQVADIVANSLKLALEDAACDGPDLEFYGRIMQNSTVGDKIGPGFITISEINNRNVGKHWRILAKIRDKYR
jgi:hypothetical protein